MADMKALIFDVDGTLAETEEAHRAAFNRVFEEQGLGWHWDQPLYGKLLSVTGGKERLRFWLEGPFGAPGAAEMLARANLNDWIAATHKRKTAIYTGLIDEGTVGLRPGVGELIAAAREQGIRLAIATTTSLPNVEALLKVTLGKSWAKVFEVIAAGDQVNAKKPAPDVYLLALQRLGLSADAGLALEDSSNGLKSALGAGLPTLITTSTYTRDETFPGALAVVARLDALAGDLWETPQRGAAILANLRRLAMSST